jgi:ABC-2 type transport system permease protein
VNIYAYLHAFQGILGREFYRFLQQKARLISSLVRPLLWLLVFAAGFRSALGLAIIPPYHSYITYPVYITPGLIGMILLFNGMQSSLSMVYDREMGSMKVLLTSPLSRSFLLLSKLIASGIISVLQAYVFLVIARIFEVDITWQGLLYVLPAALLGAIMLGALGLLMSSLVKQLENFAGVMNFVIFPLFFLSSALYPLWRMKESSEWLYYICLVNPFTHVIELIRFSLYSQWNLQAFVITSVMTIIFMGGAIFSYQNKGGKKPRKP